MTTTEDFRPGAKITANVELTVGPDGKARIGCHEFYPGDVLAFAKDVKVTKPVPKTADDFAVDTLLLAKRDGDYVHLLVTKSPYGSYGDRRNTMWCLESGTHTTDWSDYVTDMKVIYEPGGDFKDKSTDRPTHRKNIHRVLS